MKISHTESVTFAMEMVRRVLSHSAIACKGTNRRWLQSQINMEKEGTDGRRKFSMLIWLIPTSKSTIRAMSVTGWITLRNGRVEIKFAYYPNGPRSEIGLYQFNCSINNQGEIVIRSTANHSSDAVSRYFKRW